MNLTAAAALAALDQTHATTATSSAASAKASTSALFSTSSSSSSASSSSSLLAVSVPRVLPPLRPKPITCGRLPTSCAERDFDTQVARIQTTYNSVIENYHQLAANVYSLSAPTEKIVNIAATWTQQAQSLNDSIAEIETIFTTLQAQLPFLPGKSIASRMQKLQSLQIELFCIKDLVERIQFVKSPIYSKAYASCKSAIKKCEITCEAPQVMLEACNQLLNKTLQTATEQRKELASLDQRSNIHLISQVLRLHMSTLEVFSHRMDRSLSQDKTTQPLKQRLADELSKAQKYLVTSDVLTDKASLGDLAQALQEYKKTFTQVTLPTNANFKQANFVTDFFRVTFQYSNIKSIVREMKQIARGIVKLREDLQVSFTGFSGTVFSGKTQPIEVLKQRCRLYEACFHFLKEKLATQKQALLDNAKQGEVHAGLYYEALLQRMLSEVQYQIYFLKCLTTEHMHSINEAGQRFATVLSAEQSGDLYGKISTLYSVAKTLRDTPETLEGTPPIACCVYAQTHETLRYAVAMQSKRVLKLVIDNKKVAASLIQHKTLDELFPSSERGTYFTLPPALTALIAKEITEWLYFYENPSNNLIQNNLILDVILTILKIQEPYKNLYAKYSPKGFSDMVAHYESIRGPLTSKLQDAIVSFAQYFSLMNLCNPLDKPNQALQNTDIRLIFAYSEAQRLYAKCELLLEQEQDPLPLEQKVFFSTLLRENVYPLQHAVKFNRPLPTYLGDIEHDPDKLTTKLYQNRQDRTTFTNMLFTTLTNALHGKGNEKSLAVKALKTFLNAKLLNFTFPVLGQTQYLLAYFILDCVKNDPQYILSNREQNFLANFYKGYVKTENLHTRELFQKLLSALHVEVQLYKLLESRVEYEGQKPNTSVGEVPVGAVFVGAVPVCEVPVGEVLCTSIQEEDARGKTGFEEWKKSMGFCESFVQNPKPCYVEWVEGLAAHLKNGNPYKRALESCLLEMKELLKPAADIAAVATISTSAAP